MHSIAAYLRRPKFYNTLSIFKVKITTLPLGKRIASLMIKLVEHKVEI